MPRPKGLPKTGGRRPGSKNKNSLNFKEKLDAFDGGKGFDPVNEMMDLYTLIHADNPLVAVSILKALLDRMHPALRSHEHSGEISNPFMAKSMAELEAMVKEKMK